jgi:hypothetical protein
MLADWPVVAGKLLLDAVGVERRVRSSVVRLFDQPGPVRVGEESGGRAAVTRQAARQISKMEVWRAWEKARDNKGAAGIDRQSIDDFEPW